MTSKERVIKTLSSEAADRVPIDYDANPGIDARLKEYFGLGAEDNEGLRRALEVDFRAVSAPYTGKKLYEDLQDRGVKIDD